MTNPYPITPRQLDLVGLSGSHMTEQGVYPDIKMGVVASYNVSGGSAETVLKSTASGGLTLGSLNVQGNSTLRHVLPESTDTYDLGSSINLWRKGWLSELDTIIFAENTAALVGGWLIIGKDQGSIPSFVDSTDTTIDFGKTMIVGGSVVFRSSLQVEYIGIGSLASGSTVYNAVRNLDGSGANDWVEGSVFLALGESGDGRIELNAYDTPRIQMIQQGATYNQQKEIIRIGDLNGNWNYSAEEWGVAIGSYGSGSANITIDPTNGIRLRIQDTNYIVLQNDGNAKISGKLQLDGLSSALSIGSTPPSGSSIGTGIWLDRTGFYSLNSGSYQIKIDATDGKLYAGGGNITLDDDGITLFSDASYVPSSSIEWYRSTVRQSVITTYDVSSKSYMFMYAGDPGNYPGAVQIVAYADVSPRITTQLLLNSDGTAKFDSGGTSPTELTLEGNLTVTNPGFSSGNGNITYIGNLSSYKNSTTYTGYIFIPLTTPLTSTSYDGNDTVNVGSYTIDTSSVFSAPVGIKAALIYVRAKWASAGDYWFEVRTTTATAQDAGVLRAHTTYYDDANILVPCDANGDFAIVVGGANATNVIIHILGYWI